MRFATIITGGIAWFGAALAAGQEVKALSFNILDPEFYQSQPWDKRFPAIKGVYAHYAADFVLVQELAAVVKDQFYRDAAFADYKYIAPAFTSGHVAILHYRHARWTHDATEGGSFTLPAGGKNCAWGRFTDKTTGKGIYVASAHYYGDDAQRLSCAKAVATVLGNRKRKDEPVIHGGDFNSAEDSDALGWLKGAAGSPIKLRDTFRFLHPNATRYRTHHGYSGGSLEGGRKIDYVLASEDLKVLQAEVYYQQVGGVYPSDHFPVFAQVAFPSATRTLSAAPLAARAAAGAPAWNAAGAFLGNRSATALGIQFQRVQSMPKRKLTPGG